MSDKKARIIHLSPNIEKQIGLTVEGDHKLLIPYRKQENWGFCTPEKEIIIPCTYENTNPFSEGLAEVRMNDKCGYIDMTGKLVIPYKFDYGSVFKEGLAAVEKNGKYGYIDKTGKEVIPFLFSDAESFIDGLAMVEQKNKWGYIDKKGTFVIPCKYELVTEFKDGVAFVENGGNGKHIDKTGKTVPEPSNQYYYEGIALDYNDDDKVGYIDKNDKMIVNNIYDDGMDFSDGMAAVCLKGKWGFIDTKGTLVIPCKYADFVDGFTDGLALMEVNDDFGYIDKQGTEYWED